MTGGKAQKRIVFALSILLASIMTIPAGPQKEDDPVPQLMEGTGQVGFHHIYDPPITLAQNVSGPEDETVFQPGDNWK